MMWVRLRNGFARNNNLEWQVHLPDYIANINNQKHGTTKFTPNQLWEAGYQPPPDNPALNHHVQPDDHMNNFARQQLVQSRIVRRAERMLENDPVQVFNIGDHVRVDLSQLDPQVRRIIKDLRYKTIVIRYTPEIYTIANVIQPGQNFNVKRQGYTLRDPNGNLVTQGNIARLFFGNQLVRVPGDSTPQTVQDRQRASQLNRITPY
jgi:signal transduction histidine kinase